MSGGAAGRDGQHHRQRRDSHDERRVERLVHGPAMGGGRLHAVLCGAAPARRQTQRPMGKKTDAARRIGGIRRGLRSHGLLLGPVAAGDAARGVGGLRRADLSGDAVINHRHLRRLQVP